MLLNLCLLICYCSTGYGPARPDGPARYAKRPTGPCLGRRSGPQAGKARPAGHDGPPRPVRQRAGPARCRAGPGRPGPLPRYGPEPREFRFRFSNLHPPPQTEHNTEQPNRQTPEGHPARLVSRSFRSETRGRVRVSRPPVVSPGHVRTRGPRVHQSQRPQRCVPPSADSSIYPPLFFLSSS